MTATALAGDDYGRVVARVRGIRSRYRPPEPPLALARSRGSRLPGRAWVVVGALWLLLLAAPLAVGVHTQGGMASLPVTADAGGDKLLRSPFAPAPRDLLVRTATLVPQARLAAIAGTVEVAAGSPDGRFLASGYSSGALLVWDLAHHRLAGSAPRAHRRFVSALSWSPDGRTLVSAAADGAAIVWRVGADGSLTRLRTLSTAPTRIVAAAIAPRGDLLALADGRHGIVLWNLHDLTSRGQGQGAIRPRQTLPVRGRTTALAWSSDGTRLSVGTLAGDVVSWHTSSRQGDPMEREAMAHFGSAIYALTWAPDRAVLAVGSANGVVRLVSPALRPLQVLLAPFHGQPVLQVPDYGTPGGGVARSVSGVSGPSVNALSWSPRGDLLGVTAVGVPLRLWQPSSGRVVASYRDNWDMNAIAWNPNGALLAVAADDGSIRMLRATLGASDTAALLCRLGSVDWCAPLGHPPGDHRPFAPTSYMSR